MRHIAIVSLLADLVLVSTATFLINLPTGNLALIGLVLILKSFLVGFLGHFWSTTKSRLAKKEKQLALDRSRAAKDRLRDFGLQASQEMMDELVETCGGEGFRCVREGSLQTPYNWRELN